MLFCFLFGSTQILAQDNPVSSATSNARLQQMFNDLQNFGNAYNGGGSTAASKTLFSTGCSALTSSDAIQNTINTTLAKNLAAFGDLGHQAASSLLGSGCAAFTGGASSGGLSGASQSIINSLLGNMQNRARASGLPFLTRLEIETGTESHQFVQSITSIQPLWQDKNNEHHVFTQLAWRNIGGENTVNTGLAYRHLNKDETLLWGVNTFFDHGFKMNHNRMSIGADVQTSQLGASMNRYIPLSTWRSRDLYIEERAAGGWDLEVHGQVPQLPSWTASLTGYQWDGVDNLTTDVENPASNTYGYIGAVEYSPVPALALRGGLRNETTNGASLEMGLRFNLRFGDSLAWQFKPRTELASVKDRVYSKVIRENTIRVQQRRKASTYLDVIESVGANTVNSGSSGAVALNVGQSITIPATVIVANTVGAIARLRFADGAILTIGQGTEVRIEADKLTLVVGVIQYVSGSVNRTVNVPGGTITLLGTDIDIIAMGNSSTVRVRQGAVSLAGAVSGVQVISTEQMATAVSGVASVIAPGSADYNAHTDEASTKLDRVATPIAGIKIAPYPYQAPRITVQTQIPGQTISIGQKYNTQVTASGGTPRMTLTIGGQHRTAPLISGNGTDDLIFGYIIQAGDAGQTSLTATGIDLNGATLTGDGKDAVVTFAATVLPLTGSVSDVTAPTGYAAVFNTSPINNANEAAAAFQMTGGEIGATYNYTITSSGGGSSVTGNGTITNATQNVTGINTTALPDGTLTVALTLTDAANNVGTPVTATVLKDAGAPSGFGISFTTSSINSGNQSAVAIQMTSAEIGATYSYTITSSGGGGSVTGNGTITTATQSVTGINTAALLDGTLTISLTLTDAANNVGTPVTATVLKDAGAPSGYTAAFTTSPINNANKATTAFQMTGGEVGATYNYTITSSGGGGSVTGNGTITATTQNVTGINTTALPDGTLTISLTLTDAASNVGAPVSATVLKDAGAPSGYTAAFTTSPINNANKAAAAFQMTGGEIGATYNYTITSSGGGGSVTGNGTITTATQNVSSINTTALPDGTLTISLTLTDAASNVGAPVTATVLKDVGSPSGFGVSFTTAPINNGNKAAAAIQMTGAEIGATYNFTITSSGGGGSITGNGTVTAATQIANGIDTTPLPDGTLTVSLNLTDASGNVGTAVTGTAVKDSVKPTGYTVAFTTSPITPSNHTASAFTISSAEIGAAYTYTISSSGGAPNVTGSGTITSATKNVSGVDVSTMKDGTLTVSVTLTDPAGNAGTAVTNTVTKNARYICASVAENATATLTAPAGQVFTAIDFSSYGTATGSCGAFVLGSCNAATSVSKAQTALIGNNSGSVAGTNALFGDPCSGTLKTLKIQAHY